MSLAKIIIGIIILVICYFTGFFVISIIDKEDKLSKTNKALKIIISTFIGFAVFFFIEEIYKSGCHQMPDWWSEH